MYGVRYLLYYYCSRNLFSNLPRKLYLLTYLHFSHFLQSSQSNLLPFFGLCERGNRSKRKIKSTPYKETEEKNNEMATTTEPLASQARSLYRAILRELPRRPLSSPSPLKQRLRSEFRSSFTGSSQEEEKLLHRRLQETEQFVRYAQAQRMYTTLLDRYYPGINLDEQERIRLTARRVGMDLPVVNENGENGSSSSGSSGSNQ